MKTLLFTLEPGDRFRFSNDNTVYEFYILDISEENGIEVVYLHLANNKRYIRKGIGAMTEIVLIN
ncbi:hypothetical protein [Parabacteroides sp. PF5-9]|uniref:hypothetical protein n=1 Tax=Parabacteroides sp. PF5-9 TaxID=1742404 RepID=UPI002475BA96|nr:hypothetical protein [Parabacteroides sp. PF5-9]MDH6356969.1 hypothetical protein [Parabacteroides sp. PF5-9]